MVRRGGINMSMSIKQKRAIFYSDRERKLAKLKAMGLLDEYKKFNKGKTYHTIAVFCRHKGITL